MAGEVNDLRPDFGAAPVASLRSSAARRGGHVLASVHVANLGVGAALSVVRTVPKPGSIAGLRQAEVAITAPLSASLLAQPDFRRVAMIGFWDDDASIDRFLDGHPLAAKLAGGFRVRLEPLRAFGAWPGLPPETPTARAVESSGPLAALTLGRLRVSQLVRFLKTSARAEARVLEAPGLVWATGLARPPFVSTFSLWEDSRALSTYAFGRAEPAHPEAITEGERKPFHKRQAFIRFRPYAADGHLDGRNPLAQDALPVSV
jgi:hypothetical protein